MVDPGLLKVAGREEGRMARARPGIRTTDGGWAGRAGPQAGGFAQLTVAGREATEAWLLDSWN